MTLMTWLKERELNCRRIAAGKTVGDSAGWIEDAEHFKAALDAVEDRGLRKKAADGTEAEKLMDAAGLCRRCAAPKHEQLPPDYMLAKLQMVMPLMQEARDALTAISVEQMNLRGISATLAERMDEAGTFSLDDWLAMQPNTSYTTPPVV